MNLERGMIFWTRLPIRSPSGHEQEGHRPCLVLAVPSTIHRVRYPLVVIAPMTTTAIAAAPLYPRLRNGQGGIVGEGTVLIDQVLAVDVSRVERYIGKLTPMEFQPVQDGLRRLFEM